MWRCGSVGAEILTLLRYVRATGTEVLRLLGDEATTGAAARVGVGVDLGLDKAGLGVEIKNFGGGVGAAIGGADRGRGVGRVPMLARQDGQHDAAAGAQHPPRFAQRSERP